MPTPTPDRPPNNLMLLSGHDVGCCDRRPVEVVGGETCEGGPQQIKQPLCGLVYCVSKIGTEAQCR